MIFFLISVTMYELYTGYDIRDVREFISFAKTNSYKGKGHAHREIVYTATPSAEVDTLLWRPKYRSRTLAFCLRAVDETGNISGPSNVASALPPVRPQQKRS